MSDCLFFPSPSSNSFLTVYSVYLRAARGLHLIFLTGFNEFQTYVKASWLLKLITLKLIIVLITPGERIFKITSNARARCKSSTTEVFLCIQITWGSC